jgi:hypothetical protein
VTERREKTWRAPALLLAAALPFGTSASAAEDTPRLERLPRAILDVIPPEERVQGAPGEMAVWQQACRIGPTNWARRRIVDVAVQEWAAFGFQTVDEANVETRLLPKGLVPDSINPATRPHVVPQYPRLGTFEAAGEVSATIAGYWSATPDGARVIAAQNRAWSGPGGEAVNWLQPWSAAFVSWVMCEAGLGDQKQFERSIAHRVYVDQAIRARDGQAPEAAFVAYDAGEQAIEPGDLLCNARGQADYRNLADRRPDIGRFAPTHCNVVVKVDAASMRILVIGGNVEQSVSLTILPGVRETGKQLRPLDEDTISGARTIFAHLKLRADPIEANALDNSPTIRALTRSPN